jgi:O-acetyl-ADP-ribose deacetylase (regulator of RNase III)
MRDFENANQQLREELQQMKNNEGGFWSKVGDAVVQHLLPEVFKKMDEKIFEKKTQ